MIKGDLIMTPVDGLVLSISEVFHRPYSLCKNIFDISMILATIIICLICHSSIYGVGIGTVFSGYFFKQLKDRKLNRILLIATGALTNATTSQQGESIPGIAHAVAIEN